MNADLTPLFEGLAKEDAAVVLIGGFAAVTLGVPYVTADIDFCYDPEPENLRRLALALAPLHPWLRIDGMMEEEARALPFKLDERTRRGASILTLQTDLGPLDLMSAVPGVGSYADVRAASIRVDALGFPVLVLDLPALIAAKRAAGRPKDLLALPQIEATLLLRDARTSDEQRPPG